MDQVSGMGGAGRKKTGTANHQNLVKNLRLHLQQTFPQGRFFERHVGLFYTRYGKPVKINTSGMSDLWGLVDGLHFEIECKTGTGKLTKDQKAWRNTTFKVGGFFIEARSIEQVEQEMKKALTFLARA